MKELRKELDQAYSLISSIPVNGDGVDIMAAAREHLRKAYRMAGGPKGEVANDG